jgi:uncharacterized protein (UPF0276 family)
MRDRVSLETFRLSGVGIGWRPELALAIDRDLDIDFVEVVAEDFDPWGAIPAPLSRLREKGVPVIPHGIKLSLGGAAPPDPARIEHLARLAERLDAPLVSEHVAYVRAGELEAGHLLPLPRTREALAVLIDNVRLAKERLPVPLALENIATLVEWPGAEMEEPAFLTEALQGAGALLLLDIENLFANARNFGFDAVRYLESLPLDRLAYVHIAGGVERDGIYHDTHAHPITEAVLALLEELSARVDSPAVLLERDDQFPSTAELQDELAAIRHALARGASRRMAEATTTVCP